MLIYHLLQADPSFDRHNAHVSTPQKHNFGLTQRTPILARRSHSVYTPINPSTCCNTSVT